MPARTEAEAEARRLWRRADAVCFDVDSTVTRDERIDQLASFLGKEHQVRPITIRAMNDGMEFRDALTQRLDILKPSMDDLERFRAHRPIRLSPRIGDLVAMLLARHVKVFLISGGFENLIHPVAESLGILPENIIANKLIFDFDGNYMKFDENQPTSASGGKGVAIQQLIDEHGFSCVAMVGDGVTDMEASPPAHVFIRYGGNVVRPRVQAGAPWFVTDFQELIDALPDHRHRAADSAAARNGAERNGAAGNGHRNGHAGNGLLGPRVIME